MGRGDSAMMYPIAPSPSSSGISRSISTRSGASALTFLNASMPSRAVATTQNSPDPSTTSVSMRRKKALSSTTSTRPGLEVLDAMSNRADFHRAVAHPHPNGAAKVSSHGLRHQGNAMRLQGVPSGEQVPLSHLDGSRRGQRGEHAGTSCESAGDPPGAGTVGVHQLEQPRHC